MKTTFFTDFSNFVLGSESSLPQPLQRSLTSDPAKSTVKRFSPHGWVFFISSTSPSFIPMSSIKYPLHKTIIPFSVKKASRPGAAFPAVPGHFFTIRDISCFPPSKTNVVSRASIGFPSRKIASYSPRETDMTYSLSPRRTVIFAWSTHDGSKGAR